MNAAALQRALDGGKCNFARVITGSWKQWHPGMKLQRCDIFNVGKNVYSARRHPHLWRHAVREEIEKFVTS